MDPHGAAQAHTSESVEIEAACEGKEDELVCQGEEKSEEVCVNVCEEQQLQREATMRSLVHIQRRAERRWQRDRDRQLLRVRTHTQNIHGLTKPLRPFAFQIFNTS